MQPMRTGLVLAIVALIGVSTALLGRPATVTAPVPAIAVPQDTAAPARSDASRWQGTKPENWPGASLSALLDLAVLSAADETVAVTGGSICDPESGDEHAGLFLTRDGGATWNSVGPAFAGRIAAAQVTTTGLLWAVVQGDGLAADAPHLWRSADFGDTWECLPLPTGPLRQAWVIFDDAERGTLALRSSDAPEHRSWYATRDGGATWDHLLSVRDPSGDAAGDSMELRTPTGWSWKIEAGRVWRCAPGGVWQPTDAQPSDRYPGEPVPVVA